VTCATHVGGIKYLCLARAHNKSVTARVGFSLRSTSTKENWELVSCKSKMLFQGVLGLLAAQVALAAKLEKVNDFGSNPTKINMYIYVPDKVATKPAIIVAVSTHYRLEFHFIHIRYVYSSFF